MIYGKGYLQVRCPKDVIHYTENGGFRHLTEGETYTAEPTGEVGIYPLYAIQDDDGDRVCITLESCMYLNGDNWEVLK